MCSTRGPPRLAKCPTSSKLFGIFWDPPPTSFSTFYQTLSNYYHHRKSGIKTAPAICSNHHKLSYFHQNDYSLGLCLHKVIHFFSIYAPMPTHSSALSQSSFKLQILAFSKAGCRTYPNTLYSDVFSGGGASLDTHLWGISGLSCTFRIRIESAFDASAEEAVACSTFDGKALSYAGRHVFFPFGIDLGNVGVS